MFVRQLNKRFYSLFSGYREDVDGPFNAVNAAKFIGDARRVRCADYVYKYTLNGGRITRTETTHANWFFILTNAAAYTENTEVANLPEIALDFQDSVQATPFVTAVEKAGAVPSNLVFGREGVGRYEEYKNLFWVLGDRINVSVQVNPVNNTPCRSYVLLSGVEIDLSEG